MIPGGAGGQTAEVGPWEEAPSRWRRAYTDTARSLRAADRDGQVRLAVRWLGEQGHVVTDAGGRLDWDLVEAALDVVGVSGPQHPLGRLRALGAMLLRERAIVLYRRRAQVDRGRRHEPDTPPVVPDGARARGRRRQPRRRRESTAARAGPEEGPSPEADPDAGALQAVSDAGDIVVAEIVAGTPGARSRLAAALAGLLAAELTGGEG